MTQNNLYKYRSELNFRLRHVPLDNQLQKSSNPFSALKVEFGVILLEI